MAVTAVRTPVWENNINVLYFIHFTQSSDRNFIMWFVGNYKKV